MSIYRKPLHKKKILSYKTQHDRLRFHHTHILITINQLRKFTKRIDNGGPSNLAALSKPERKILSYTSYLHNMNKFTGYNFHALRLAFDFDKYVPRSFTRDKPVEGLFRIVETQRQMKIFMRRD